MTDPLDDIATEQWTVEPYEHHEVPMYIASGPHRILLNINLDADEMHAVALLPELVRRVKQAEQSRDELRAALAAAEARERQFSIVVRHMELDGAVHGAERYIDHLRSMLDAALAAVPQETP